MPPAAVIIEPSPNLAQQLQKRYSRPTYRKKYSTEEQKGSRMLMTPSGTNMPLPQRLRSKFTTALNGVFTSGGTAQRLYNVKLNGLITVQSATGGGSIAWEGPFVPLANIDPTGLSILLNATAYTQYRVLASSIKMSVLPESISDNTYITITHQLQSHSQQLTLTELPNRILSRRPSPVTNTLEAGEWLSHYIAVSKLMGVNYRSVQDDVSLVYNAIYNADPSDIMYWVINFCQSDNVAPGAAIPYTVIVTHYVELFGFATASLPE